MINSDITTFFNVCWAHLNEKPLKMLKLKRRHPSPIFSGKCPILHLHLIWLPNVHCFSSLFLRTYGEA